MPTLWTFGTSTRSTEELLKVVRSHRIETIVDVRHFPGSRRFPHFGREALREILEENGVRYLWLGETLGGYRKGGYEAHMQTPAFLQGIEELVSIASVSRTAILCAEALPWRCHRRFIAQAMEKQGWRTMHLLDENRVWSPGRGLTTGKQMEAGL